MAGLADFGFFLLFDEVDDDEREEYDEQNVTLPIATADLRMV